MTMVTIAAELDKVKRGNSGHSSSLMEFSLTALLSKEKTVAKTNKQTPLYRLKLIKYTQLMMLVINRGATYFSLKRGTQLYLGKQEA